MRSRTRLLGRLGLSLALVFSLWTPVAAPASSAEDLTAPRANAPKLTEKGGGHLTAARLRGLGIDPATRVATGWGGAVEAGEVLVVLDGSAPKAAASALTLRGARVERASAKSRTLVVSVPKGFSAQGFARVAARAPGVAWVQPNYRYQATATPNDPMYFQQWGMARVGAAAAWSVTSGKPSVTVAVIDTGVSLAHPDLSARVDTVNDYDFVNGDTNADDDEGHGTHVAGIIAATADNSVGIAGVAPGIRILPIKVLDANGSGNSLSVADGIRYAADRGVQVINMSLGGPKDPYTASAVTYAQSKGCVVVAATGNDGINGVSYPGALKDVVGVGAIDSSNLRASFSNYGTGTDLVAPGVDILSTLPGATYGKLDGTSMATPFVAGVAALLASAQPGWSASQIIDRMFTTAHDLGSVGTDSQYGHGLVRADVALTGTAVPDDDNIPGVALPPSPVAGTLDRTGDRDDVYAVLLGAGQTLDLSLTGAAGTDFDLWLYGVGATDVNVDSQAVASSRTSAYPEHIAYVAPTTGVYYVDVYAFTGGGSYSLSWSISGITDDNIPGKPITPSPVNGTVDSATDIDDVYRVHLEAGQMVTAALDGPDAADFDMWLFGPDALDVQTSAPLVKRSTTGSSEFLRFVAQTSGDYYVDVWAYSGSGAYQLKWNVGAFDPDDNIPGVDLAPSPATGSVGGLTDTDDVYKVYLQAGQHLDLSLAGAGGTNHDLYVYGPGATDVDVDPWVTRANTAAYPEVVSIDATATGYYYVDIYNTSSPGAYTLAWTRTVAPDDDIPGVNAPDSPIIGAVGVTTDSDDVYRVHLTEGETFVAYLGADAGNEFDLYLYGPGATSMRTDEAVAADNGRRYPKTVIYQAPATGDYYLNAHAYAGDGEYALAWGVPVLQVMTSSPSGGYKTLTRKRGKVTTSISAKVTDQAGQPIIDERIVLEKSTNGWSWSTLKTFTSSATGRVSAKVTFTKKGTYFLRWRAPGNTRYFEASTPKVRYRVK
jgi:thermitase